jgi:hypothetical protein
VRSQQQLRRATPTTHAAGIDRFLFPQLNHLAEDKRFELLRVLPDTLSNYAADRPAAVADVRGLVLRNRADALGRR